MRSSACSRMTRRSSSMTFTRSWATGGASLWAAASPPRQATCFRSSNSIPLESPLIDSPRTFQSWSSWRQTAFRRTIPKCQLPWAMTGRRPPEVTRLFGRRRIRLMTKMRTRPPCNSPTPSSARGLSALGRVILYDTVFMQGDGPDPDSASALIAQTVTTIGKPGAGTDAKRWWTAFLNIRRADLLNPANPYTKAEWPKSTGRIATLHAQIRADKWDFAGPLDVGEGDWTPVTIP